MRRYSLLLTAILMSSLSASDGELSRVVASMESVDGLELTGGLRVAAEGPKGGNVLRADESFTGRVDLKARNINPLDFHLIKVEVKADRGAFLRFSLENFPRAGELSHWYVLDTARGVFEWRTIWIDLNKPEEIKAAGTYKGMGEANPEARGLRFDGSVKDLKRAAQGSARSIWLGPIRFCRKAIDLDWDMTKFTCVSEKGKDLVCTYPLTIANKLDKAVTAKLKTLPFVLEGETQNSSAVLSAESVQLAAGETKTVEAKITLPVAVVEKSPPLYTERFEVRAEAEGVADSEVTILRSSDPMHLPVVVPVRDEKLAFPLLPHKGQPLANFDEAKARESAAATGPDDLNTALGEKQDFRSPRGFNYWGKNKDWGEAGARYLAGLTACAFLYDKTGDKEFLEKGTAMLVRAAELWPRHAEDWKSTPYSAISHGIFSANVLSLGWSTGSMRPAYSYARHGIFNDFDLLASGMDEATRKKILDGFIVPAGLHMRGHYFGLTNQQDVINNAMLYAGLAGKNWPLAAHAYNAEHGFLGQLQWGFSDDGLAGEVNYHSPALDPITWTSELLLRAGIDVYNARLRECIHSRSAKALGKPFDGPVVAFFDRERFKPEIVKSAVEAAKEETDGVHLAGGITTLKWKGREVCMNWGEQLNRSAPDRCSLRVGNLGGGNYTHNSLGQSIIIIDENKQNSQPAEVTGVDVTGPVQFVQASSDKHYPAVAITRTFALIDKHTLVIDRVANKDGKEHTVDWCFRYPGGKQVHSDFAKTINLTMTPVPGSFTTKEGDKATGTDYGANLKSKEHIVGETEGAWTQSNGSMLMAGEKGTQVMVFAVAAAFSAGSTAPNGVPVMMVRRANVRDTDYIAAFSPDVKSIERVPVKTADGKEAAAIGVKVALNDGKVFHAIVNYEAKDVEVVLGELKTTERFATDYQP